MFLIHGPHTSQHLCICSEVRNACQLSEQLTMSCVFTSILFSFLPKLERFFKQRQEECFLVDTDAYNCNHGAPCVTHACICWQWTLDQAIVGCLCLFSPSFLSRMVRRSERMSQWLVRGLSHTFADNALVAISGQASVLLHPMTAYGFWKEVHLSPPARDMFILSRLRSFCHLLCKCEFSSLWGSGPKVR